MRALLKNSYRGFKKELAGTWVDIDTTSLFTNQYNTTEEYGNMRIFDGDIERIEDDARIGKGRCKYCGAIVNFGEEDKHFEQKAERNCEKCFYYGRVYDETKTTEEDDGATIVKTTVMKYHKECNYNKDKRHGESSCNNDECKAYDIDWFTPDNTFFLRYPNGYITTKFSFAGPNALTDWVPNPGMTFIKYNDKLGSYTLEAKIFNFDGITGCVEYFTLHNGNTTIRFRYDSTKDEFIVFDGINSSPNIKEHILDMRYAISSKVESKVKKLMTQF